MSRNQTAIVYFILINLSYQATRAQTNTTQYEIGAGLSSFIYQGDLTPSSIGSFRTMRPGIYIHGSKILSSSFSLRTQLTIGGLRGNDATYDNPEYRQQRNFNFRSRVIELSQQLTWNPLGKNYTDKAFSPYVFAGVGISFLKIKRDWSNFNAEYFGALGEDVATRLTVDAAHSVPKIIPVIPVGLGVRYNLSPRWAVNAESAYRVVFTDYLDGFSQAANPDKNDHYHTISAGAIYRIGKKNTLACPVLRY